MGIYFGKDVDIKIGEYCAEPDIKKKNSIFEVSIRPAFEKLIESQLYLYSFFKIDDPEMLKNECLSNLYEILPKFDPNRGKKAFSYFNVVVKNWFIWKIREKKKRLKMETENFYGIDHEVVKSDPSIVVASYEDEVVQREYWVELFKTMESWRPELTKKQEVQVLDAIIFLLQNPYMVSIYNKKAVYYYIKEMTGLSMKQVNHNMNSLRSRYLAFKGKFHGDERGEEEDGDGR